MVQLDSELLTIQKNPIRRFILRASQKRPIAYDFRWDSTIALLSTRLTGSADQRPCPEPRRWRIERREEKATIRALL